MWPRSSWLWLTLDKNVRAILPFSLGKMTPQFTRQVLINLGSNIILHFVLLAIFGELQNVHPAFQEEYCSVTTQILACKKSSLC